MGIKCFGLESRRVLSFWTKGILFCFTTCLSNLGSRTNLWRDEEHVITKRFLNKMLLFWGRYLLVEFMLIPYTGNFERDCDWNETTGTSQKHAIAIFFIFRKRSSANSSFSSHGHWIKQFVHTAWTEINQNPKEKRQRNLILWRDSTRNWKEIGEK